MASHKENCYIVSSRRSSRFDMCLKFNQRYLNKKGMERKKVVIELEVLTSRMTSREIERDLDRVLVPLRDIESGQTTVKDVEVKEIV